jgi:glycine dehydrogenase subunit 2
VFNQGKWSKDLIFNQSTPGRVGFQLTELDSHEQKALAKAKNKISPSLMRKTNLNLPEVSELEVIRHFTRLSQMNYGIDTGMYPLGS